MKTTKVFSIYHMGNILLRFSKEINANSAILIEIYAIREDLLLVSASWWASSAIFLLKSYSLNAVNWFTDIINKILWRFTNIIRENIHSFSRHISRSISHICRSGNETTDVLAKIGAHGSSFVEFV